MENREEHWSNIISKKELLEKYKISYGALYRWKRKGLIPEEWFIKKSTVTGQETFFPEKLICERIELIQSLKEEVMLDELAKKLVEKQTQDASITVYSEYGKKTFYIKDITKIEYADKFNNLTDITQSILKSIENKSTEDQ